MRASHDCEVCEAVSATPQEVPRSSDLIPKVVAKGLLVNQTIQMISNKVLTGLVSGRTTISLVV